MAVDRKKCHNRRRLLSRMSNSINSNTNNGLNLSNRKFHGGGQDSPIISSGAAEIHMPHTATEESTVSDHRFQSRLDTSEKSGQNLRKNRRKKVGSRRGGLSSEQRSSASASSLSSSSSSADEDEEEEIMVSRAECKHLKVRREDGSCRKCGHQVV